MVETITYEVTCKVGNVEIRRYPKIVVAKVTDPQADAFSLLYNFITGNNARKEKVKMTSPVVSEKIAMTSPVLSDSNSMAFVMPKDLTIDKVPEPLDNRIKIEEIPSHTVGAICFSGGWSEKHFEKETQTLLDELSKAGIKTKGNVFTMLYNPPYIPGFLRRNEVAIEVKDQ
ncbi:MAG: heme-binding protein [Candidatus Bathyarchaeia archaeon]